MFFQALGNRDGEERLHQWRASLEADFFHEVLAVLFGHVAKAGVHEGIRQVGDAGEIEGDRLQAVPDAFDLERAKLVRDVPIGEKIAEFDGHLEFEFHGNGVDGMGMK